MRQRTADRLAMLLVATSAALGFALGAHGMQADFVDSSPIVTTERHVSNEVILAIIVAIPLVISSLVGAVVSVIGAVRAGKGLEKISVVEAKTAAIQAGVNGAASEAREIRNTLETRNRLLEQLLAEEVARRTADAATAATAADHVQAALKQTPPKEGGA